MIAESTTCADAAAFRVVLGELSEGPPGQLELVAGGHRNIGSLASDGTLDLVGIDPFEHWHGTLTATGGSALYEVVTDSGCTQRYTVALEFVNG